jgi:presenilin-like A22 family membrane protease
LGIIAGVSAIFSISTGSLGVVLIKVVVAVIDSCFIKG